MRDADLREFVRSHEVCWESERRVEWRRGQRIPVGCELTLFARHAAGLAADPGSHESRELQQGLAALAWRACAANPPDGVLCRVVELPSRLVLRPENEWAPEALLRLEVLHETATFAGPTDAQREYVDAIQTRLAAVGARERRWSRAR